MRTPHPFDVMLSGDLIESLLKEAEAMEKQAVSIEARTPIVWKNVCMDTMEKEQAIQEMGLEADRIRLLSKDKKAEAGRLAYSLNKYAEGILQHGAYLADVEPYSQREGVAGGPRYALAVETQSKAKRVAQWAITHAQSITEDMPKPAPFVCCVIEPGKVTGKGLWFVSITATAR